MIAFCRAIFRHPSTSLLGAKNPKNMTKNRFCVSIKLA
jgi:hypothetical protein